NAPVRRHTGRLSHRSTAYPHVTAFPRAGTGKDWLTCSPARDIRLRNLRPVALFSEERARHPAVFGTTTLRDMRTPSQIVCLTGWRGRAAGELWWKPSAPRWRVPAE